MTKIRIKRTVTIIEEIPFKPVFYPEASTAADAAQSERDVDIEIKLLNFTSTIDSTLSDRIDFQEEITVIDDKPETRTP